MRPARIVKDKRLKIISEDFIILLIRRRKALNLLQYC